MLRHRHRETTAIYAKVDRERAAADRAAVAGSGPHERAAIEPPPTTCACDARSATSSSGPSSCWRSSSTISRPAAIETITVEHALAWATAAAAVESTGTRSGSGRSAAFARYLHDDRLRASRSRRPTCCPSGQRRAVPYLYTDEEIAALLEAARRFEPRTSAATFRTLIGLLAATGMRIGEAIALDRADFDADHGVLVVRDGKFGKSRELPLHPTTTRRPRRATCAAATGRGPWVRARRCCIADVGTTASRRTCQTTRSARSSCARWDPAALGRVPAPPHDLRHTFAVRTLLDAYRSGEPIAGPRVWRRCPPTWGTSVPSKTLLVSARPRPS